MTKRKRKQSLPNFFGIHLQIPNVLSSIVLQYCSDWYCINCNLYYPNEFECLNCTSFENGTYITRSSFTENSANFVKTFENQVDQNIWDYIELTMNGHRTFSGRSWTGSNLSIHKLTFSVQRKRTRRDRDWWYLKFVPYKR